MRRLQRRQQVVGPGAGRGDDFGFQIFPIERRNLVWDRLHEDVQPSERRVTELGVLGRDLAGERTFENRLNRQTELRREPIAGNEHETADEAVEVVAAEKQRKALPLFELENAARHLMELVVVQLKEFVARKGLDDVGEHASSMTARLEARSLQNPRELAAQQRDAMGAAVVDLRREQAGQNIFAVGPSRSVEALDHDSIT